MNKEQQIEEMTKIVDEYFEVYCTTPKEIAESLYEAGYRKVGEEYEYIKGYLLYTKQLKKKVRKETAKEIYKEARERVYESIEWLNCSKDKPGNKYMKGVTFGLKLFDKALINVIKKYGVEVEG